MSKALSTVLLIILVTFCCHFFNRSGYSSFSMYLCPGNEPLKQAGDSASGVLWLAKRALHDYIDKQIKAECGIENGLLFVTLFFLNPSDCFYLQKVCDFIPSYYIFWLLQVFCKKKIPLSLTSLLTGVAGERGMRNEEWGMFPLSCQGEPERHVLDAAVVPGVVGDEAYLGHLLFDGT